MQLIKVSCLSGRLYHYRMQALMGISCALPINQQLSKLGNSLTMWWLLSSESGQPSCMYPMYPVYNCLMMALFLWGLRYKSPDWSILCRLLRDFLREGPVELRMVAAAPPLSKAGQLVQQCSAAGKVLDKYLILAPLGARTRVWWSNKAALFGFCSFSSLLI